MQNALRMHGVRSVSMPNQTVFQTAEAADLLVLLEAMAFPGHEGHLRSALVTSLIGYGLQDMEALIVDPQQWDTVVDSFITARDLWIERGFMHALQSLMVDLGVAERLLAYPDGEQRMTNLLQLAELLQVRSREIASQEELILWLQNEIRNGRPGDDALLLRLESDEGLVQIVTMHKSKGLEYPVVYLPFPWAGSGHVSELVVFHDRDTYGAIIDAGSDEREQNKVLASEEKLSEDLRLLYVALTRSKSACKLYWGNGRSVRGTALWYLLHPTLIKTDYDLLKADVERLAGTSDGCIQMTELERTESVYFQDEVRQQSLSLPAYRTRINRNWGLSSYTGLLRGEDADLPDHDETVLEQTDEPNVAGVAEVSAEERLIASLPAGAKTGQLLHEIFEFMDFTDLADIDQRIADALLRYGSLGRSMPGVQEARKPDWNQSIKKIIENTLAARLDSDTNLSLESITPDDRLNEMEFFFSVKHFGPEHLKSAVAGSPYSDVANGLNFAAFEGLMQGFIDMVVRKAGRYYIVDYKSNFLGESEDDYNQAALGNAIRSHRYDLQYLIYTVALYRYLQVRLPDFDYDKHFGGVYYLFVRGMRPGSNNGVWKDLPALSVIQALDSVMARQSVAA